MNPFRTWLRPFLFAAIVLLAGTAALTPFHDRAARLGMVATSTLGVCAAGVALVFWLLARHADAHLAAFEQGVYLAHWTYDADEWRAYAQQEWEGSRKMARAGALTGLLICGPPALLFWTELGILGVAGMAAFGLLLGWGLGSLALARAARQLEQVDAGGRPQVYIGKGAALLNGRYISWSGAGTTLTAVTLVPGPPAALELTMRVNGAHATHTQRQRIPVPAGRQQEAERVIRELGYS